jgi:hypothetical protein
MQEIAPAMGIPLDSGATLQPPGIAGRVGKFPAQSLDEAGTGHRTSGVRRREYPNRVGSPKRPNHGRRIVQLTPRNEMLEQGEPRIVQGNVGGGLSAEPQGEEDAGQGRRDEENAKWYRHRTQT